MRSIVMAVVMLGACLTTSARACINDSETQSSERIFRSSYADPVQVARHSNYLELGGVGAALLGTALLAGGTYRALRLATLPVGDDPTFSA